MPFKYPEKVRARRSAAAQLQQYTALLVREFTIPADELLRRVEQRWDGGVRPSLAVHDPPRQRAASQS